MMRAALPMFPAFAKMVVGSTACPFAMSLSHIGFPNAFLWSGPKEQLPIGVINFSARRSGPRPARGRVFLGPLMLSLGPLGPFTRFPVGSGPEKANARDRINSPARGSAPWPPPRRLFSSLWSGPLRVFLLVRIEKESSPLPPLK